MKFSIIIAVAPNRSAPVLECFNSMNYPTRDYEVIIEKGLNPSENRNRGIHKAKYDNLIFLDDDCIIEKDYLKKIEQFLNNHPFVDIVGGPQLTPASDNLFAKASSYVMSSFFGTSNMSPRYKKSKLNLNANESHLTSANLIIKKQVFQKTNGFNPKLWPGEDPELISRLKKLGFIIAYSPDIVIYHKRRSNLSSFFEQFFSYGKQYVLYKKILKENISLLHWMPTLFTFYLILTPLLYFINIFLVTPLMLYIILTLIFSTKIILENKHYSSFPYLPFLFFAVHISYGLGLIRGLLK